MKGASNSSPRDIGRQHRPMVRDSARAAMIPGRRIERQGPCPPRPVRSGVRHELSQSFGWPWAVHRARRRPFEDIPSQDKYSQGRQAAGHLRGRTPAERYWRYDAACTDALQRYLLGQRRIRARPYEAGAAEVSSQAKPGPATDVFEERVLVDSSDVSHCASSLHIASRHAVAVQ